MSPAEWVSERRYRLLELVRQNWGEDASEKMQ